MDSKKGVVKILMTGLDNEISTWLKDFARSKRLAWKIRNCEPLRIMAPDNQVLSQDVVILAWDRVAPANLADILDKVAPTKRSLEGVLHELDKMGGEAACSRIIVLGKIVTREDAMLLAEYNIKHIFPLSAKRSKWSESEGDLIKRIEKIAVDVRTASESEEQKHYTRFLNVLPYWSKLSDEVRMQNSEQLLKALGDTPRYAELMARKCIAENDYLGAEKWLLRALTKNVGFMRANQLLADVYIARGKYDDALHILEKLKANNPRSLRTLTRLGQCYSAKAEPLRAEKYLMDALSIDEFCREAREELGKIKFGLQEYELARKLFSHSTSSRPLASYFNKIGIQLVQESKYQASIEHYRWAQYVLPGNDQGHLLFFNIALAYAKWGRTSEALGYARLAKIRSPEYDKAQALLKKLEEKRAA